MKIFIVLVLTALSFNAFSAGKAKDREPASTKSIKSVTCSNAAGDGGYTVTIFNYKRATVLENNQAGAFHIANLNCGILPTRNVGGSADMIQAYVSCGGKGLGELKDKELSVVVSHGGFAGITEADLLIDGKNVADNMSCK